MQADLLPLSQATTAHILRQVSINRVIRLVRVRPTQLHTTGHILTIGKGDTRHGSAELRKTAEGHLHVFLIHPDVVHLTENDA